MKFGLKAEATAEATATASSGASARASAKTAAAKTTAAANTAAAAESTTLTAVLSAVLSAVLAVALAGRNEIAGANDGRTRKKLRYATGIDMTNDDDPVIFAFFRGRAGTTSGTTKIGSGL